VRSRNALHVQQLFGAEAELPKIAPDAIPRPALARWLGSNGGHRVRMLSAPPGMGKTTGVVLWLRTCAEPRLCVELPPACDERTLRELCGKALAPREPTILVIDGVERATPDACAAMERLAADPPARLNLVYVGRSRTSLDVRNAALPAAGSDVLRFDADDVRRLCEVHGVSTTDVERVALVRASSGWAVVVAGAIRTAAVNGIPLPEGLARWRRDDGRIIASLIDDALETSDPDDASLFRRILGGDELPTALALARLADAGLFAQDIGGRIRLNPLVLAFPSGPRASLEPREAIPLEIEVFGTFRVRVGGQEIRFARRRDRNIVEFLALRRDGKASRTELLETFWPGGDRGLARQGLRTACSMIRRAFGACVGEERVSAYFEADAAAVVLRSESSGNRYLQFVEQVERAREAERSGAPEAAERSWSAAAALYTGPLLAAEELAMPWVAQAARAADAMAAEARRRIGG
jgi:hypothetical protein